MLETCYPNDFKTTSCVIAIDPDLPSRSFQVLQTVSLSVSQKYSICSVQSDKCLHMTSDSDRST